MAVTMSNLVQGQDGKFIYKGLKFRQRVHYGEDMKPNYSGSTMTICKKDEI